LEPVEPVELLLAVGWVLGSLLDWVLDGAEEAGVVVVDDAGAAWTVEVTVTGAVAAFGLLLPHAARLPATAATAMISAKRTRTMTFPT
jgi:hypothetical protein